MIKTAFHATAALAAMAALSGLGAAPATATELKFASFVGGGHVMNRAVFEPWAKEVAQKSGGKLTVKFYYGGALGKGGTLQYKRAVDGVADIVWTLQGYTSKQFRRTTMIEMPDVAGSAIEATKKMWAVYDKHLAPEYSQVKVLAIWALDAPIIHTKTKRVSRIEDIKGMKIRTPSQIQALLVGALGATPLAMPAGKIYNSLERGLIDGVLISPSAINNFKLNEVTRHHSAGIPWGRSPFMAVMNKKSYDSLSKAQRDIIDQTTGLALSLKASEVYTEDGKKGRAALQADSKRTYEVLPKAEIDKALQMLRAAEKKIVDDLTKEGAPVSDVLSALRDAKG